MTPAPPRVEVVTVGDELLLGTMLDGNGAWLGRCLGEEGILVVRRTTIGDDEAAIRTTVAQALERTGVVICTGGLGPTPDDRTRAAIAALFGRQMVVDEGVLDGIRARFQSRGLEMPEMNRVQAEVPVGARVLPNPRGTAPGLALSDERGRLAVLLPGVPAELYAIVARSALPLFRERWPVPSRPVRHRWLRTTGIPESLVAERVAPVAPELAPLTVAFLPSAAGVDLRITAWGDLAAAETDAALDEAAHRLERELEDVVYARGGDDLSAVVLRELQTRGLSLAVAESCTGGLLAKRLTDVPGASTVFKGGVVAYADEVKIGIVGVPAEIIAETGAVSNETARELAVGIRRSFAVDAALSITGIAGPGGGSPEKPVGTVCIGAALGHRVATERLRLHGDRQEIRERAAQASLALLWRLLREEAGPRFDPGPGSR